MRKRLFVRGSGKLTGTVRYGELELERGGQIAGNISVLATTVAASVRRAPAITAMARAARPCSAIPSRAPAAARTQ